MTKLYYTRLALQTYNSLRDYKGKRGERARVCVGGEGKASSHRRYGVPRRGGVAACGEKYCACGRVCGVDARPRDGHSALRSGEKKGGGSSAGAGGGGSVSESAMLRPTASGASVSSKGVSSSRRTRSVWQLRASRASFGPGGNWQPARKNARCAICSIPASISFADRRRQTHLSPCLQHGNRALQQLSCGMCKRWTQGSQGTQGIPNSFRQVRGGGGGKTVFVSCQTRRELPGAQSSLPLRMNRKINL